VHPLTPWENYGYTYENRGPALCWYGAPEWLIRPADALAAYTMRVKRRSIGTAKQGRQQTPTSNFRFTYYCS